MFGIGMVGVVCLILLMVITVRMSITIRISLLLIFFQHQSLTGSLVVGPGSATEADPFKRQQVMPPTGMPSMTNSAVAV
jgi:hypothetical protein